MLGKGLESLIPSSSDDGNKNNKPVPPADLPIGEDDIPSFIAEEKNEPVKNEPRPYVQEERTDSPAILKIEDDKSPEITEELSAPVVASGPSEEARREEVKKEMKDAQEEDRAHVFYIEVDKVKPNPHQPRRHFAEEAIKDLAASIREFGVLQPIVVTKVNKDVPSGTVVEYELIAGERRLKASKLLGLHTIPAIIRNVDLEKERLELAVIENLQRENLNPVEMARAFARLQDEFRMTQREIASRLGKSRETVANTLRLLDLPMDIQEALSVGKLTESHGRFLLSIHDPAVQRKLFEELLRNPMTTRELRSRMREERKEPEPIVELGPELKLFQERLSAELGAPVAIHKSGETGKITIHFYSPEELQNILNKLAKEEDF